MTNSKRIGVVAAALLAAGVVLARAGRAEACGSGGGFEIPPAVIAVAAGVLVADVAFPVHDLLVDRTSTGAAIAEAVIMTPQALLGGAAIYGTIADGGQVDGFLIGYTALTTACAVHAYYVLGTRGRAAKKAPEPRVRPVPPYSVSIAPTLVTDGRALGTGLGVVGRF